MSKPLFLSIKISFIETFESWLIGIALAITAFGVAITTFFFYLTQDTYYQGVVIDGIEVGGLTKQEARSILMEQQSQLANVPITVSVNDVMVASQSSELGISKDYSSTLTQAFEVGRSGFPLTRIYKILKLSLSPQVFTTPYTVDKSKIDSMVSELATKVDVPGQEPGAALGTSGAASTITIFPGKIGSEVDQATTTKQLTEAISRQTQLQAVGIRATVASTAAELNETEIAAAQTRTSLLVGKEAKFTAKDITLTLNDQELIELLTFPSGYNLKAIALEDLEPASPSAAVERSLLSKWSARITREPQEPVFQYDPTTLKVTAFTPPRDGLTLDIEATEQVLLMALRDVEATARQEKSDLDARTATGSAEIVATKDEFTYELPVKVKPPKKSLADTNNLGIKERIGFGESEYDHSIPSRIHNVALAATKINNYIVAPGQEFSFNQALGDVSQATGFKPAYVIQGGRTVLGDGGGVCQVSTTVFRAILNAGLQVTKRKQHSYRVSYYELNEKPGVDATVYSGEVDLRFINDTNDHILITTHADSNDLYMNVEIYGTSDGRSAEIVDHKVWDYRNPPAPVYIPDPSLPPGATKQVDWAVSGVKTQFTNVIKDKAGNEIRRDEYYSNYVPWSAKYLQGV